MVSEWVERYQMDPEAAMLEMVQFFVQCSGCRATISRDMFRNQEASTVIRSLTENFAEVCVLLCHSQTFCPLTVTSGERGVPTGDGWGPGQEVQGARKCRRAFTSLVLSVCLSVC